MPSKPILYLCPNFPMVSETFISDQVEALLRNGIKVHVMALHEGNSKALLAQWQADPVRRDSFTILYGKTISKGSKLKSLLRVLPHVMLHPDSWLLTWFLLRKSPKIVLRAIVFGSQLLSRKTEASLLMCHFGTVGQAGNLLRAWGIIKAPQITVFHGQDISSTLDSRGWDYYNPLFKSPAHTSLTITHFWHNRLQTLGAPDPQLIKLGVDVSKFTYTPRTYPDHRAVRFISVGRLTEKKGYAITLEALARLPEDLDWEYHIVGNGDLREELESLTETYGLDGKVIFHGGLPHSKTQELLSGADAFILASHTAPNGDMEGLPIALLEGAATGLPIVTSTHSAIPELFRHRVNGLVSEEGDAETLSENLKILLTQPQLWPKLTAQAQQDVVREQNFHNHIQKFIAFVRTQSKAAPRHHD